MRSDGSITIPGALAVVLLGLSCSFLGSTLREYFHSSAATSQHLDDQDRYVDQLTDRIAALEANCKH